MDRDAIVIKKVLVVLHCIEVAIKTSNTAGYNLHVVNIYLRGVANFGLDLLVATHRHSDARSGDRRHPSQLFRRGSSRQHI